jgi:LysM repeat protein
MAKIELRTEETVQVSKYVVRRGDSLWKISRRFKVSPANLRRWNSLRGNRITPGDVLTIKY